MNLQVDKEKCVASGACVLEAPEVFDLDDDGTVSVLDDRPAGARLDSARRAASVCPAAVIHLVAAERS